MEATISEIDNIFSTAKNQNELQFVFTLINYRYVVNPKLISNVHEWFDAIEFYKDLFGRLTGKERIRIGLLLYSTFFENSDFYNVIGNLCRCKLGFSASSQLFWKTKKQERLLGTGEKIKMLSELLADCGYENIIAFFSDVHFEEIRNTFFHSAYSILDDNYILLDSEPIELEGRQTTAIPIATVLTPLIEKVIIFFDKFRLCYLASFADYHLDKNTQGYFPTLKDVTIHGSAEGLKGVTIHKTAQFYGEWADSGIYYDERFNTWVGRNIYVTPPDLEQIEIGDELKRYESKNDIKISNSEFFNLVDKVCERGRVNEMVRILDLLMKFGDVKYNKWLDEGNEFKRKSLKTHPLVYYKKLLQLNRHLDLRDIVKKIQQLEE